MEFAAETAYIPSYWKDEKPAVQEEVFLIDCDGMDLFDDETRQKLFSRIEDTFERVGLVHLVNTGLEKLDDMREVAKVIVKDPMVNI